MDVVIERVCGCTLATALLNDYHGNDLVGLLTSISFANFLHK